MASESALRTVLPTRTSPPPVVAPDPPPRVQLGHAQAAAIPDRWAPHPGEGLTPERLLAIFRAAERGEPQQQCDLFADVREVDAHLRSQWDARIGSVARKPRIVQAGGDRPEDQLAALILDAALKQIPNVTNTLEHLLDGLFYGYAGVEVVWGRRGLRLADGRLQLATVPVQFILVEPRRFIFDEYDRPRLLTSQFDYEGEELDAGRWMWWRERHRFQAAGGLMRTACRPALLKRLGVRDLAVAMSRYGLPMPIGLYELEWPDEEKETLKRACAALATGRDAYATMLRGNSADGMPIVFPKIENAASPDQLQGAMIAWANDEISKLITGATLLSETKGPGSYALGQVHADRGFELVAGDAQRLYECSAADLGRMVCALNGLDAAPPAIKVHVVRSMDPEQRMKLFTAYVNELGGEADADQVQQEFQIKPPTGETLKGSAGALPAPSPKAKEALARVAEKAGMRPAELHALLLEHVSGPLLARFAA